MIRKAFLSDSKKLWSLKRAFVLDISKVGDISYCTQLQQDGFFVSNETENEHKARITNSTIFNVYEKDEKPVGLIDINHEIYFPKEADNIIWLDQKLKIIYFEDERSVALHQIVVDKKYQGTGIATEMLQTAVKELINHKIKQLFSIVTTGPVTNCPSIVWHTAMGFERACVTNPIDLFGLKNYTSLLFYKNLN